MIKLESVLVDLRENYPVEIRTTSRVVGPDKLSGLMRGGTAYAPFPHQQEWYYFFELETDAEYFKRKYVSNF